MRILPLALLITLPSISFAQPAGSADPELAKYTNLPTVHQVTEQERKQIKQRCTSYEVNDEHYRRSPNYASSEYYRENKEQLDKCHRQAAINLEILRTKGTAIEQNESRFAEEKRQEGEQEAAKERHQQEILANPKNTRLIFGAEFCIYKQTRAEAIAEIAKEKKYAKLGGMIDKVKLYHLQQIVRAADEMERDERKALANFKGITPAPCSDAGVKRLIACSQSDSACDTAEIRELAALVTLPADPE